MAEAITLAPGVVTNLPLSLIDLDPNQPRKDIPAGYIEDDLGPDIKANGVKQPVTVRPNPDAPGRYLIKYGECRYRGSKWANKKTIPSLLDEKEAKGKVDPLTRLLEQVKENHHRRDLNAMDWSGVLRRMREDHGIKSLANIEKTLKAHGINNMGESYISNLMRLTELPDWAQDMIRTGQLTAGHGKHLLQALASALVTEDVKSELERNAAPSVSQLQQWIYDGFSSHHNQLADWIGFDAAVECKGCKQKKSVDETAFCLDDECYNAKVAAARAAKAKKKERAERQANDRETAEIDAPGDDNSATETTQRGAETIQVDANNTVDVEAQGLQYWNDYRMLEEAEFNTDGCAQCEHNHIARPRDESPTAVPCCFDPKCYIKKVAAARAERARTAKLREVAAAWLRRAITANHIQDDTTLQLNLLAWLALQRPAGINEENEPVIIDDMYDETLDAFNATIIGTQLIDLRAILTRGAMGHAPEIAALAVRLMDFNDLMMVGKVVGIAPGSYRLDAAYLALKSTAELRQLLGAANLTGEAQETDTEELIAACLRHAEQIGAPADMLELLAGGAE